MDPHVHQILVGTFLTARSVKELSDRYGIPLASCYRKTNRLRRVGLLRVERTALRLNGRPVNLFRAHLPNAEIEWRSGRVVVSFAPRDTSLDARERVALTLVA